MSWLMFILIALVFGPGLRRLLRAAMTVIGLLFTVMLGIVLVVVVTVALVTHGAAL